MMLLKKRQCCKSDIEEGRRLNYYKTQKAKPTQKLYSRFTIVISFPLQLLLPLQRCNSLCSSFDGGRWYSSSHTHSSFRAAVAGKKWHNDFPSPISSEFNVTKNNALAKCFTIALESSLFLRRITTLQKWSLRPNAGFISFFCYLCITF